MRNKGAFSDLIMQRVLNQWIGNIYRRWFKIHL